MEYFQQPGYKISYRFYYKTIYGSLHFATGRTGKLNLDDKLSKFLPSFPKADSVTIHMLLNHTSGIASYTDLPAFRNLATQTVSMDSMISFFTNSPYNFSRHTIQV